MSLGTGQPVSSEWSRRQDRPDPSTHATGAENQHEGFPNARGPGAAFVEEQAWWDPRVCFAHGLQVYKCTSQDIFLNLPVPWVLP